MSKQLESTLYARHRPRTSTADLSESEPVPLSRPVGNRDLFDCVNMDARIVVPESSAVKWVVVASVIVAFLLIDFLTSRVFEHPFSRSEFWIVSIFAGIYIGQVNLIATWAALGPGNIAWRLPWSLLLGVLMWYSLMLGYRAESGYYSLNGPATLGAILLGGMVIAQIPLWIAGRVFRWQLIGWSGAARQSGREDFQFRLQHLFLGMMILCVALAPARAVLPSGRLSRLYLLDEEIMLFLGIAVFNLLITVPCIWGAFLERRLLLRVGLGWLWFCGLFTTLEFALLAAMFGPPLDRDVEFLFALYFLNVCPCVTVFGTLLIFRALGVRLVRLVSAEPSAIEAQGGAEEG